VVLGYKDKMSKKIARVVFNLGVDKEFDYSVPEGVELEVGTRLWVEFSRKKKVGVVTELVNTSPRRKLNPIIEVLDNYPCLSKEHIEFAKRLKKDYPYSLGEIIFMMLPPFLKRKKKINSLSPALGGKKNNYEVVCIKDNNLLRRVEKYQKEIEAALNYHSVIICFPLLTSLHLVEKALKEKFLERIVVLHSYLKEREMFLNWQKLREGRKLVLGTKVSLFYYPLDLGLIVVEEENSPHYFHQEKPYYHLLDIVRLLSKFKNIRCILSTDYPTLSTYKLIKSQKVKLIEEKEKNRKKIEVLPLTGHSKSRFLNSLIIELIRKNLQEKKKILLLWRKKGFATLLRCHNCGYVYRCKRCSTFLRLTLERKSAECVWCGYRQNIPSLCEVCNTGYIKPYGLGIERLRANLKRIFPRIEISDLSNAKETTPIILANLWMADTYQLEKKGIDICFLLDADFLLSSLDFEATFNLYLYLKKLSWLVKDKVYVTTHSDTHYLWQTINKSWRSFYKKEASLRKELNLPPYGYFAKITLRAKNKNTLLTKAQNLYNKIKNEKLEIFGPLEDFPFKLRDKYRYCLIIKSKSKLILREAVEEAVQHYRSSSTKVALMMK